MSEVIAYSAVGYVRKQLGYGGETLHNRVDPHTICLVHDAVARVKHKDIVDKCLRWKDRWLVRNIALSVELTDTEIVVHFNPNKFVKTPGVLRMKLKEPENQYMPHVGWTFSHV